MCFILIGSSARLSAGSVVQSPQGDTEEVNQSSLTGSPGFKMAACPSSEAPRVCVGSTRSPPGLLDVRADPRQVVPVSPKMDDSERKQPLKVCGTIGGGGKGLPRASICISTGSPASCQA